MRIVIAEDSAILRDGLAHLLTLRGHEVVAQVADPASAVEAVDEHRPDVAVLDIRMPPTFTDEGIRVALALRGAHPDLGILVFSQPGALSAGQLNELLDQIKKVDMAQVHQEIAEARAKADDQQAQK